MNFGPVPKPITGILELVAMGTYLAAGGAP